MAFSIQVCDTDRSRVPHVRTAEEGIPVAEAAIAWAEHLHAKRCGAPEQASVVTTVFDGAGDVVWRATWPEPQVAARVTAETPAFRRPGREAA